MPSRTGHLTTYRWMAVIATILLSSFLVGAFTSAERAAAIAAAGNRYSYDQVRQKRFLTGSCEESDRQLESLRNIWCCSIVGFNHSWCPWPQGLTTHHDWPSQTVYMVDLLDALAAPTTCLNTSVAAEIISNLADPNNALPSGPGWMGTFLVFQVQYYDMPRHPGVRIESPFTLGEKCWAFALLKAYGRIPLLEAAVSAANLTLGQFGAQMTQGIPFTMNLCEKVMANCFVNASYNPARNGTCPLDIDDFRYLGFGFENLKHEHHHLSFPFY